MLTMHSGYHRLDLPVGWEDLRVRNVSLESKLELVGGTFSPAFRSCEEVSDSTGTFKADLKAEASVNLSKSLTVPLPAKFLL